MRIYEILSGETMTPLDNNQGSTGGSFATPQMDAMKGATAPQQPPMQQANALTDYFMSGPKPIGGAPAATQPPAPQPAGTPPAQSSGMISRPFGNSAIGQGLDAINTGLKPQ